MQLPKLDISPGALLTAAGLFCCLDAEHIPAVLLPVLFHEAGHIIALSIFGMKIRSVRAEIGGLCIDYSGCAGPAAQFISAAAGPLFGIIYACCVCPLGAFMPDAELSAGISLVYSLFNLLPAMPLDGGNMLLALLSAITDCDAAERISRCVSLAVSALLMICGAYLMCRGFGAAMLLAGWWIAVMEVKKQ